MINLLRQKVKNICKFLGFDVRVYDFRTIHKLRKIKLIHDLRINVIIDGGANVGQFAQRIFSEGYSGRMISVEPLPECFAILKNNMIGRKGWTGIKCGLGDLNCQKTLNVSSDTQSSSILTATGIASTESFIGCREELISIRRLDEILTTQTSPDDKIYLKLDVQGYEDKVLDGLGEWLDKIAIIEIEASTIELYRGEPLFHNLASRLANNYSLYSLDEVLVDYRTGRLLQIEMLFVNNAYLKNSNT